MSSINYEEDQRKDLDSVNESDKLSDQVVKLTKSRISFRRNHSHNDAGNEYLHIKTRRRNFS
jgi:hypothetical protein